MWEWPSLGKKGLSNTWHGVSAIALRSDLYHAARSLGPHDFKTAGLEAMHDELGTQP